MHHRNEDAFRLEVFDQRRVAAVVCDGISSASAGNVAARDAARAAGAVLAQAAADPGHDPTQATLDAIEAAQLAVLQVPWTTRTKRVDPSCTLVSALCFGAHILIGWVGDSRAYWLDSVDVHSSRVDDSFAEEGVAKGLWPTPEQAADGPFLHSSHTGWGDQDAPERPPRLVALEPDRPGRLVLCTDGLWNYGPGADELGRLVAELPADATPAAVARALADMANDRGGRDNITVAVVEITPPPAS